VLGQTSNTAGMILILKPREKFSDPKFWATTEVYTTD
jgi:hypothetical protein